MSDLADMVKMAAQTGKKPPKAGFEVPVDGGLDLDAGAPAPSKPIVEPVQARKVVADAEDQKVPIGSRRAGLPPQNEIDFRAARATGRNAPINTKVKPEYRKMLYQGALKEGMDLCVVIEEMILARYGRQK